MEKINVTKPYLPPFEEYIEKISTIWDNHFLTNYGPLNKELVDKLESHLKVKNIHYVTNGTIALQLALEALNIKDGDIITTPFTFIATISAIVWQRCNPVFVDINPNTFNIDVNKIEDNITSNTKAILAVHCFGYPCDIEGLSKISKKYNLPIIYDAAHSFGTKIHGKSIFSYGDISVCSLHATKAFHSIEGGLCIINNEKYNKKLNSIKNFGINNGEYEYVGINAKASEFNAAMGLCVLDHLEEITQKRKHIYELYKENLSSKLKTPNIPNDFEYNYLYFPVLFESEEQLNDVFIKLNKESIYPRRYFYPCVNDIRIYENHNSTPIAKDISSRIACLPSDTYLRDNDVKKICKIINSVIFK